MGTPITQHSYGTEHTQVVWSPSYFLSRQTYRTIVRTGKKKMHVKIFLIEKGHETVPVTGGDTVSLVKEGLLTVSWATLGLRTTGHELTWNEVESVLLRWFKQTHWCTKDFYHQYKLQLFLSLVIQCWASSLMSRSLSGPFCKMGTLTPFLQGCWDCIW